MKRVLLDQGLPPEAAALLRGEGWDAVHQPSVVLLRREGLNCSDLKELLLNLWKQVERDPHRQECLCYLTTALATAWLSYSSVTRTAMVCSAPEGPSSTRL